MHPHNTELVSVGTFNTTNKETGQMKLIKDWTNGGLWQWRYFSSAVGVWFDYGNPFREHANALRWMEDGGIQT